MKTVRIGIVLPEDARRELRVRSLADMLRVNGERSDKTTWTLHAEGETIDDGDRRVAKLSIEPVTTPEQPQLVVENVRAGRGFHWEQAINITLPGTIEVTVRDDALMLVNELPLETYLAGVLTSEMSGECPLEFLKAQCVTARSWMIAATERKHADLGIDFCNDDCCQRFQGIASVTDAARRAADETAGEVMVHDSGVVVDANYSKSCGGIVEAPVHVWGHDKPGQYAVADGPADDGVARFFPLAADAVVDYVGGSWLKRCRAWCSPNVVPDADLPRYLGRIDDGGGHFRWRVSYTADELCAILNRKRRLSASRIRDLAVTRRGVSGRATAMTVDYVADDGGRRTETIEDQYAIRDALSASFLYSSAFDIRVARDAEGWPTRIELIGAGWGHGAGLCQIGALGMALSGFDYRAILHHYFTNMQIERIGGTS